MKHASQGVLVTQPATNAYSVYGHASTASLRQLAFNAEHFDTATDGYMLGQGYRCYSPALMKFKSLDSWSPFGQGGINAYAYCTGDPVNRTDPSGHADVTEIFFLKIKYLPTRSRTTPTTPVRPPTRGAQAIRALAAQVEQMNLPAPNAINTGSRTTQQQVGDFIRAGREALQRGQDRSVQETATNAVWSLTAPTSTAANAQPAAVINNATAPMHSQPSSATASGMRPTSLINFSHHVRQA